MMKLPSVNRRNWRKILRELDESKFPSLTDYLRGIKQKLENKEALLFSEESLGYASLVKYFQRFNEEINEMYASSVNWDRFSEFPPFEHQKPAVDFLLKISGAILADDMGLGKSMSSIYASLFMDDFQRILIVTIKSLKYNFAKEINRITDDVAIIDNKWIDEGKFVIVHYEQLKKYEQEIKDSGFNIIIMDEVHKIRNPKAGRTKAAVSIINYLRPLKLWFLTGTPLDNRPYDYYYLLKMIGHPIAKDWRRFVERYCDGHVNQWGQWEISGASNLTELHKLTQDVILRRLKTDLDIDLPGKTRKPIFLKLSNKKGYDKVIEKYREEKFEKLKEEVGYKGKMENVDVQKMTQLILWRQFCALEKVNDGSLIDLIDAKLEEDDTNKIIVFTNFTAVVDAVKEKYGDICFAIDGRIKDPKDRLRIIDEFNDSKTVRVIVLNMKVGGTGLNIQGANKVIVNDMDWVPSTMLQAEDRAWRIGQLRDVEVIYPIYDDTVEVMLYKLVEEKMRIITSVVDGQQKEYFKDTDDIFEKDDEKSERDSILKDIFAQMGL